MIRGIAIIAVVFIHNTPAGLPQVYCRPFLNFAVGIFLFLSGMLSDANRWNPRKRITKVAIPYILWSCIYVFGSNYDNISNIPVLLLKNLLTGKAAAIMYYIFVYCEFTLLIPIIDKLARSKYKWLGFVITPAEIICMRLLPLVAGYEVNKYVEIIMGISCLGWFTYYYLGYLLGNGLINVKISTRKLVLLLAIAIILQIVEGYWYLSMGEGNCGTQLKLSAILTGSIAVLLAYRFIHSGKLYNVQALKKLGDCSFGIYFSHLAVQMFLGVVPYYSEYIVYPINAIVTVIISFGCVLIGKKILGKYSKYLAL